MPAALGARGRSGTDRMMHSSNTMIDFSDRISLGWVTAAWFLFRARPVLWMLAASSQVLTLGLVALLVTGHLPLILQRLLSAMHVPGSLDWPFILLIVLGLLLSSLLANTAMTSMANRVVRGEPISTQDLFHYPRFAVTSLVLVTSLLAVAFGFLVFLPIGLVVTGLVLSAQSTALRTGKVGTALRTSASILRAEPAGTLSLATFLLLAIAIGVATSGLGLLIAIPIAKIISAFGDHYLEMPLRGEHFLSPALVPPVKQFHWTPAEEAMLRRTAPPPHLPHMLGALLVVGLAAFLLFPRMPAATASIPASTESASPAPVATAPDTPTPAVPLPPAPSPPDTSGTATTEPPFVDSYGTTDDFSLPCQMHWGSYTVRIEEIGTIGGPDGEQQRITVFNTAGLSVYTVADEGISLVKPENLLGGKQPELLIHTTEGSDGMYGTDLALTQQGGVHDIFFLDDAVRVTPVLTGGKPGEISVDRVLDGPHLGMRDYPRLTATYRWNGTEYENVSMSAPALTMEQIEQDEHVLVDPANQVRRTADPNDDWTITMETAAVGLIANASLIDLGPLPSSVTSTPGYQLGAAWLRDNPASRASIVQEINAAKKSLPFKTGSSINLNS